MRKRRPMVRALSLLLSLILALSLLPGAALAAETDNRRVYSPEEVDSVLDQVVKGGALTDAYKDYDLDGDKKLTTWDAKKMLDALPEKLAGAIRFKAMRVANGSADWVDVTIQDGKVSETTVLNEFTDTLVALKNTRHPGYTFYPEAGALCGGKLMLQVAYYNDGKVAASDLVPVDPDSFAAPAMNAVGAFDWHDVTALSDGRMLGVASIDKTLFSLWQDGKWMADGYLEKSALGGTVGSVLVGIASAGTNDNGDEVLYGLTKDGKLYRFSLTVDGDGSLELTTPVQIGESNVIPDWYYTPTSNPDDPDTWQIDSASLLATGGYLLASVTYVHTREFSNGTSETKYQSVVFVIDPEKGSCVPVALPDGVVLNSLYQYEQGEKEGVRLYVDETPITLKAGTSVELPAAEAYSFSTDETTKLVTNSKLDNAVTWSSSDTNVVTINTETGKITAKDVTEQTTVTLTATATANDGKTDTKEVTVTVNPDKGMKVGAMINTSGDFVWAEINLDMVNDEKSFTEIDVKNQTSTNYTAGGYARGMLWGYYNSSSEGKKLYPLNAETFAASGDPITTTRAVRDLTGAPEVKNGISYSGGTMDSPASLVYVTSDGLLGLLNGKIKGPYMSQLGSIASDYDGETALTLSAIAYVGDLTVNQVRGGTGDSSLSNCDGDTLCHVYYALTKDAAGGATLRQLILVPQVGTDNTLSYTLCGSTIGTVAGVTGSPYRMSMDFLRESDDSYGLLVAWGNGQGFNSIYYIDLAAYATNKNLKAELTGKVDSVTVDNDSKSVNSITGLYHTENTKLSDTQIYKIAGWNSGTSSQSLAEVTLEASLKAVSAEQSGNADLLVIPVYADKDATNGLWKLEYNTSKLQLKMVPVRDDILYSASDRSTAGTVTVGFASRTALSSGKDRPLFTVAFTKLDASASASDVKITQVELNDPKGGSGDNTGGNTGGNTGTVTPSKPETLPFTDVEEGSYCYDAVRWAVEKGVTEGVSETAFAPNEPCTRGQAVTFLWRAAGSPAPRGQEMPFTDVAESSPYAKAILWAAENGVTKGVTETTFAPNNTCVRGQIVTFLYRLWS